MQLARDGGQDEGGSEQAQREQKKQTAETGSASRAAFGFGSSLNQQQSGQAGSSTASMHLQQHAVLGLKRSGGGSGGLQAGFGAMPFYQQQRQQCAGGLRCHGVLPAAAGRPGRHQRVAYVAAAAATAGRRFGQFFQPVQPGPAVRVQRAGKCNVVSFALQALETLKAQILGPYVAQPKPDDSDDNMNV